jgi:hypothetical protein
MPLYIVDSKNGTTTDLIFSDYVCTLSPGDYTGRFYLSSIRQELPTCVYDNKADGLTVSALDGSLTIKADIPRRVGVYDVSGRCLIDEVIASEKTVPAPAGMYIITADGAGETKIVIR